MDLEFNESLAVVTSKSCPVKDSRSSEGVVEAVFARIKSNKDMGGIVEATVEKSFNVNSSALVVV